MFSTQALFTQILMAGSISSWGHLGFVLVGFVISIYLLACLALRLWHGRLIFLPSRTIQYTPDQINLAYEDVWLPIETRSGKIETIHGWWIPSKSPTDDRVILDFHGNRNNIGANLNYAQLFHQLGLSVFLVDYRGYGRSTPRFPSESAIYQDVERAWHYLVHERQISPEKIFVFGHSLGGAIAINLATQHPEIAGLIIEGSFTSIRKMVDYRDKYWMFPVNWILTQRFDSITKVPHLKMPILYTHGTEDTVVPPEMSQTLYELTPEPKQLLVIPEAGHNDVSEVGGQRYRQVVGQFLSQTCSVSA
ncbi:MAG: alpha/beta hydrolase [Microcoleaceae cyanobacterium]